VKECPHCKDIIKGKHAIYANHVRWCKKNPKFDNVNSNENISKGMQNYYNKIYGKFKEFSVICFKCKKSFNVTEREKQFPKKEKYFCSRVCANTKKHSEKTKQKISNSINELVLEQIITQNKQPVTYYSNCVICNKKFDKYQGVKTCSKKCASLLKSKIRKEMIKEKHKNWTDHKRYREECQFKFNLSDFPDEFHFELIKEFGWYKAKNNGNNPNGISRDHMISIKYGWENNIDASIISHPANCKLLQNPENQNKNGNCSITLEQLLYKIEKWNKRYSANLAT